MRKPLLTIAPSLFATLMLACQDSSPAPGPDGPQFAATASASQYHFVANGLYADSYWNTNDPTGYGYGWLNVSQGGSPGARQTFLNYYSVHCDWNWNCTWSFGYGPIPNRDVSFSDTKAVHLSTNTNLPDFYVYPPGSGGPISMDWTANGFYTSSSSGTSRYDYPGFSHRQQGRSTSAPATATGTVVGISLTPDSASGSIGTNHSVNIDIYR